MKTAFCTNVFEPAAFEQGLRKVAELGYDAVELWQKTLDSWDLDKLERLLSELELGVAQVCPYFDFTGNRAEWDSSIQEARRFVALAARFEAPLVRAFTGHIGGADATVEQWEAAIWGLRAVCALGAQEGIVFALETHPGCLMDCTDGAQRLLREVGAPNLGLNLQVPLDDEDPLDSMHSLAAHVVHLHAHNWIGPAPGGQWEQLTCLGSGDLDFPRFLAIARSAGFDGYVSIEHATHHGRSDPLEVAAHEIAYLRGLFDQLGKAEQQAR